MSDVATAVPKPPTIFLVATTVAGISATTIYVPTLTAVVADLSVSAQMGQLTLSVFLVMFAVFQLVYGPLADRHGRKPVLLAGLAIFLAANLLAALAQTIEVLLAARVLQGIGACAGLVIARAMVRDAYGRKDSARVMGYVGMGQGLSALFAPVIGGSLQAWTGDWHAAFFFMVALTLLPMTILVFAVRETLQPTEPASRGVSGMVLDYVSLLREPRYLFFAMGSAMITGTIYLFLSSVPFVLANIAGATAQRIALLLLFVSGGYIVGNIVTSAVSARVRPEQVTTFGVSLCFLGVALLGALGMAGLRSELVVAAPMVLFGLGNGLSLPASAAIAVGIMPRIAGTASALFGFGGYTMGTLGTVVAGFLVHSSQMPLAGAMLVTTSVSLVCFVSGYLVLRRDEQSGVQV